MPISDTDRLIISTGIVSFNILGLFGNLNVIYAHYRLPALRTRFGILLTLLCISQSICLVTELIIVIYALMKVPVVRSTCFTVFAFGIFMHCTLTGLMTTISLDLFISVVFPLRHRLLRTIPYLVVLSLPTLLYGSSVLLTAIVNMDSSIIPLCNIPLALRGAASRVWYYVAFFFGGIIFVTYLGTFFTLACKKKEGRRTSSSVEKKAIRSISVLVVVFLVTRFAGNITANLLIAFGVDNDTVEKVQSYNIFVALINYSITFYVCIFRSSEYRQIFRQQITSALSNVIGVSMYESRVGTTSVGLTERNRQ